MQAVESSLAKLLISGPPGSGKTTAVRALSDIAPITTEVLATDELALEKEQTTVGMDFGEITLEGGEQLAIYGTPGQPRFAFMWQILLEGAAGLVLLINHLRPDPLMDLREFVPTFGELFRNGQAVIGISRFDDACGPSLSDYADLLAELKLDVPVFTVDVRVREDMQLLVETLSLLSRG